MIQMRIWKEFQLYTHDSLRWWRLDCDQGGIHQASMPKASWQWLIACFSKTLKDRIEGRLHKLLSKVQHFDKLTEEQRILIEKTKVLLDRTALFTIKHRKLPADGLVNPYFDGERYYNFRGEKIWWQFLETLRLFFPGALRNPTEKNLATWNRVKWVACAKSKSPKITWLGHASILLQIAGLNLLFDPSYHFVFPCFRRHAKAAIPFHDLPKIDIVAISHSHGDHFEESTLKELMPYQPFAFVPEKLDDWFRQAGYKQVTGPRWWTQTILTRKGSQIKLTAIPAQHGSATSAADVNKTLWMGIMIEAAGKKIYFAGDTAYNSKIFHNIKQKFGKIDLALLPIAPEGEQAVHLDHVEALQTFKDLGAKRMMPIHWGAYRTGYEQIEEPIRKFRSTAQNDGRFKGLFSRIHLVKLGESLSI